MKAQIWTIPDCPFCVRAKRLMKLKGIEYEEISGFHDNWKTVPYLILNGEEIGGFTEFAAYCRKL
jgi:glutaredoxin